MPDIELKGTQIDVVEQTSVIDVIFLAICHGQQKTEYIVECCNRKQIWGFRRLKYLGATEEDLLDVNCKHIRIIAEFAVPVWYSSLTRKNPKNCIQYTLMR